MLVTGKQIMDKAREGNYAVGAFNVNNMEIVQAIISAADAENAPVILQTSEGAVKYAGVDYLKQMVYLAASKTKVPVALHLDHGTTYETIIKCIANGWTSIMYDGSHHSLEDNIAHTKEIAKICHGAGISIEAELGRLGGIEDNISVDEKDARLTSVSEAVTFVQQSDVDYLAIAIGTAHGKYKGVPKLDFDRLREIRAAVSCPLVLHGASGVPEDAIVTATKNGINKINIDTDVRVAFTEGIKAVFAASPDEFDPRKICGPARDDMIKVVRNKIQLFGASGKNWL